MCAKVLKYYNYYIFVLLANFNASGNDVQYNDFF